MSTYQHYLYDLGLEVKLRALEALRERDAAADGSPEKLFHLGRVLAFNEIISIMQQQAAGFDIPLAELRLEDIVPDRDLL